MNHSSHHPCRILSFAYLPYSAPLLRRREPCSIFAKQITFHQLFSVCVCQFSRQLNSFPRRHHAQVARCKMASTLHVCICLDVSVIVFPLKGHFLVIYYRGVETNWMNSLVRAGFHKWMREEPIFTCNQHKMGKKRGRKLSLRTNESSPFSRLSPALMEPPHAAMPPSHHQSGAGKGATGIRFLFVHAHLFHRRPPERLPAVGATPNPPPFLFFFFRCQSE